MDGLCYLLLLVVVSHLVGCHVVCQCNVLSNLLLLTSRAITGAGVLLMSCHCSHFLCVYISSDAVCGACKDKRGIGCVCICIYL